MNTIRKFVMGKNLSVVGANELGVSVAAVTAWKCSNVNVSVVDFNSEEVDLWNEKKVKGLEPDLEDLLGKCLGQNLSFSTDIKAAITSADIIVLMLDDPDLRNLNMTEMAGLERAARLIAEVSDGCKIIVQKCSNAPLRTCEALKTILNENKSKKASFQVLAIPEFFSSSSPVSYLLNPDFVFIGHEESLEGEKAAAGLIDIYTKWVPKERIKTMNCVSVELSRICINAFLAQKLMTMSTFAAICEQADKNFREISRVLTKINRGGQFLEPPFSLGDMNLYRDTLRLIHLCEKHKLNEVKDYWEGVSNQNDDLERRFKNKIFSAFFNTLSGKKLAFFGVSSKRNGKITNDLPVMRLSVSLLEEEAELSLYDPNVQMSIYRVFEVLKVPGVEKVEERVTVYDNPYKAAYKANGIIFWTDAKDFRSIDFAALYKDMKKPAFIFDGWNMLDHITLIKMGFKVKTIGKDYSYVP